MNAVTSKDRTVDPNDSADKLHTRVVYSGAGLVDGSLYVTKAHSR
jgi:hypothetical protein